MREVYAPFEIPTVRKRNLMVEICYWEYLSVLMGAYFDTVWILMLIWTRLVYVNGTFGPGIKPEVEYSILKLKTYCLIAICWLDG